MRYSTLHCLIPAPCEIQEKEGRIAYSALEKICIASDEAKKAAERVICFFSFTGKKLEETASKEEAHILFAADPSLGAEAWKMEITQKDITIFAGGKKGFFYGSCALEQMGFAALREGPSTAFFDCGTISDSPRFSYRGFMLDPSRHFQDVGTIKKVISILSTLRINTLHWHLADNQSFRMPVEKVADIVGKGTLTPGAYTRNEIREITAFAAENNIAVIPELDVPGHSKMILSANPHLACNEKEPGREYCLGNPESKEFIKGLLDEIMELFPESKVIHIGGDEADTTAWEKCPRCLGAMKEKGFRNMRELENDFMTDISRHIASCGRTPMMWGTCSGQIYPSDTIMQAWLDIREPLRIAPNKNKVVYSVHTSLYFDYPASPAEPQESWMFELTEKGVYMTDPYILWEETLKDTILGPEGCLWTEKIPQWRILPKLLPRISALSECAWSRNDRKDYYDFRRRREYLEAAGYYEYLRSL